MEQEESAIHTVIYCRCDETDKVSMNLITDVYFIGDLYLEQDSIQFLSKLKKI